MVRKVRERAGELDTAIREVSLGIGRTIQEGINQGKHPNKYGFFLAVFEFGEAGRFNYVSNARRGEVVTLLREMAEKFENDTEGMS